MIVTKTPYRLSFFGGGTDYRPWFQEHGGLLVTSAMKRYSYITLRYLPPFFEHKSNVVYSKMELVDDNDQIQHPAIRSCLKFLEVPEGIKLHHDGDLPARSGTGSSSTFTVGLLKALHALRHEMISKDRLAKEAITVEQQLMREDVGIQDQIIAAYGGFQAIHIKPGGGYNVTPIVVPPEYLKSLESHILLGFTGISRNSNDHAQVHIENIESGRNFSQLREIHDLAKEALRLISCQADLEQLGKLLDQSWKVKRGLTNKLSNDQIDDMYHLATANGAYGGKLMGAGGGGFMMFLAPPETHEKIKEAIPQVKVWVPFEMDHHGSQLIFHNNYEA